MARNISKFPPCFSRPFARNTSGIVGVAFNLHYWNGQDHPNWMVTWNPAPNVQRTRRFHWHKFKGTKTQRSEAAKLAAAAFRKEQEIELVRQRQQGQR